MEPAVPSAELLLKHAEFLRRIARGILHDADAADDVAQEAIVASWGRRPADLRAWLGKVARRLALTRRRSDARRARRELAAARPEEMPSAAEGVARLELQRRVVDAVLALKEPYRSVVMHRYFYDFGPREIATRTGVPVETVRTRLRRALDRLRESLDQTRERHAWSIALLAVAAPRRSPLGGVLAMSAKAKFAAASLLLLACGLFSVPLLGLRDRPVERATSRERSQALPDVVAPPPSPLSIPIDFAAVDRDLDVHGVVVDAAGNAIAGAAVRVVRYPAMGRAGVLAQVEWEGGVGAKSRVDGSFALRVERGEEVDLHVSADGFVPLQRRWCAAGGRLRIVMRTGARLRVSALGPANAPLADAHVLYFKGSASADLEIAGLYVYLQAVTDARGQCGFDGLLPQRASVWAWHAEALFPKPVPVEIGETGEFEVQLKAETGRAITGRVTDADRRAAVPDALILPHPMLVPFAKQVRTGADGSYRFAGWGPAIGTYLYAHAPGYATARESVGDRSSIDFALLRGITVSGTIRDKTGNPVPDAYIVAEARGGDVQVDFFLHAKSGPDGRYELRDLPRASGTVLSVSKRGFARAELPLPEGVADVVLSEGNRVEGRVLGFDGEPLEGLLVELKAAEPSRYKHERHTDDLGRFRFADVAGGGHAILVALPDRRQIRREIVVETTDVTDVDLRFERGREFTVRVVDAAGLPVRNVLLAGGSLSKRTDAHGEAVFELPRGIDAIQVSVVRLDPRYAKPPVACYRLGQGDLRIVIHEAATVSGRVLLDGSPLAHAVLEVHGPDGFDDFATTDGAGDFSARVPAGTRVSVALNGQVKEETLPIYGEIRDVLAGSAGIVVAARRVALDRTLVVRVVTPAGEGVAGMKLWLSGHGWRPAAVPVTDEQGRFAASGLPAAEFHIALLSDPPAPWARARPDRLTVEPTGQEVRFTLREGSAIRGALLLPDGRGVEGYVLAWRGDELVARARSGPDGGFAIYIAADEPAPVRLEASVRDAKGATLGVTLHAVAPGSKGVELRLGAP